MEYYCPIRDDGRCNTEAKDCPDWCVAAKKSKPQATNRPVPQVKSSVLLKCLLDEMDWVLDSYLADKGVELLEAWNKGYKAAIEAVAKKMNVDLAAL